MVNLLLTRVRINYQHNEISVICIFEVVRHVYGESNMRLNSLKSALLVNRKPGSPMYDTS